jgi:tetratricopeptide (TPR) repeat protein
VASSPPYCTADRAGGRACLEPELVLAFLDGRLPPERRAEIERVVDECDRCRKLVAEAARADVPFSTLRGTGAPSAIHTRRIGGERPAGSSVSLRIGSTVGRHLVVSQLGRGGMGLVYLARDPQLGRPVVIKLVVPELDTPEYEARLVREAQSMARLSHPNVVSIYDIGTVDGRVFLAMEYVDGGTLQAWLAAGRRSAGQILRAFVQAGRGLEAAHAAGIVHRDFKPHNALWSSQGVLKVTDFGLARAPGAELAAARMSQPMAAPAITRVGAVIGTPGYMAPEQLVGDAVDARTDQFAFCVALFDALTGQRPGARDVEPLAASREQIEQRLPVSRRLRRAISRGLSSDPSQRFGSMSELLAELERVGRRRAVVAAIGAGAGGLALAGALLLGGSSDRDPSCADRARELDAVWNPAVAAAIDRELAAAEVPFVRAGWRAAGRALDRRREEWSALRLESCRAGGGRDACLAGRRAEVEAFVERWRAAAPTDRVALAIELDRLPAVESCAGAAPSGGATERAEALLAVARDEVRLGHLEQATVALAATLRAADEAGSDIVRAAVHLELVDLARRAGNVAAGRRDAEQARSLLARIGADAAADLALRLSLARLLIDDGDMTAAAAEIAAARELATATWGAGHRLAAQVLVVEGEAALRLREEPGQALALADQALAAGPDRRALALRGEAHLVLGKPAEALADFERAIALDRNHLAVFELRARAALAAHLAGQSAVADAHITEALSGSVLIFGAGSAEALEARLVKARMLRDRGDGPAAQTLLREASYLLHDAGAPIPRLVELHMELTRAKAAIDHAEPDFSLSGIMTYRDKLHPRAPLRARILLLLGEGRLEQDLASLAAGDVEEAIAILEANGGPRGDLGAARFILARSYLAMKWQEKDKARAAAEAARADLTAAGRADLVLEVSRFLEAL